MKWTFMSASIGALSFCSSALWNDFSSGYNLITRSEVIFAVVGGTFLAYALFVIGQKSLHPTMVSVFNYFQPVVGTLVTLAMGTGSFGAVKAIAMLLIFLAVWKVVKPKTKRPKTLSEDVKQMHIKV